MALENDAQWTHESTECHFIELTLNYHKLLDLSMIAIMDLCKIEKIIIGSIEGSLIEKKITALSHCVCD